MDAMDATEKQMYRSVFDDFALGSKHGAPAVEGASVKASLLMLGVDEEQIEKRFAKFIGASTERDLTSVTNVSFDEWLELASVYVME